MHLLINSNKSKCQSQKLGSFLKTHSLRQYIGKKWKIFQLFLENLLQNLISIHFKFNYFKNPFHMLQRVSAEMIFLIFMAKFIFYCDAKF